MFKKLQVHKLSSDFREAVKLVTLPIPEKVGPNEVLIRNYYLGVNATDVNTSAGRYFTDGKVPFDIGFEALGKVEIVGDGSRFKPGDIVMYLGNSAYAEYLIAKDDELTNVPELNPKYVSVYANGLTAAIGLDLHGQLKKGTKILVTAAAGGLGHLTVQLAKLKGCHVVGTCSTKDKQAFLTSLGCDRAINYREENLDEVLTKEYPDGLDVIWETIGGSTCALLFNHVAERGKMIVLGGTAGYKDSGFPQVEIPNLFPRLIMEAKTLNGFQLMRYPHLFPEYSARVVDMANSGQLRGVTDDGSSSKSGPFIGLNMVADALDYIHSGANKGKVIVQL